MAAAVIAAFGVAFLPGAAIAASCTTTNFVRDGFNLTAAVVNPAGPVTGTVDATGCNIGVYYDGSVVHSGTVSGATVENANYYGIVNNGANVSVTGSTVSNIGESPFNGDQHGVGIYWAYGSVATGTIKNNIVGPYQKGGIVVNGGGSSAAIGNNTVIGSGPVNYIAENGIQIGFGATGTISNNNVTGNEYTGTNDASSGGILIYGSPPDPFTSGVSITNNTVINNDVGVWLSNANADGSPPSTPTDNLVKNNKISKTDGLTNISGDNTATTTCGYQAGISDDGNSDSIVNNKISGNGYVPGSTCTSSGTFSTAIDTSTTLNPNLNNNKIK
jgi:hypothetical protein